MTKYTKITIVLIGLAVLVWTGLKISNLAQRSSGEKIKIGAIASLTGKGAQRGESARMGLELAQSQIQRQAVLKNASLELIFEDLPFGEAKRGPAIFEKLVEIDKVVAVIGPMGSNESLTIASLVDKKQIPVIVHTASALEITNKNDYVFRLWPTAINYISAVIPRLKELGYSKIAAISTIRENTLDFLKVLQENLSKSSEQIEIAIDERVGPEDKDYRTSLLKIKQIESEVLFLNLFEGQIGLAAKQAWDLGLRLPIFTNSVTTELELEAAAGHLEGAWYPRAAGYSENIRQEFLNQFGQEPTVPETAAAAADALLALAKAISQVGTSGEEIRTYLYGHEFEGVSGKFRFLPSGDAEVPVKIKVVREGKIVNLQE